MGEIKFSERALIITKSYADNLRKKREEYITELKNGKNVFVTIVTTFGVKPNSYSADVMNNQVTMDSLFEREI